MAPRRRRGRALRSPQYLGSGHVEKANELLVARRQKQGGLRWRLEPSDRLGAVQTRVLNGGWERYWVEDEELPPVEARAA